MRMSARLSECEDAGGFSGAAIPEMETSELARKMRNGAMGARRDTGFLREICYLLALWRNAVDGN